MGATYKSGGFGGLKYKTVPKSWRSCVPLRRQVNRKPSLNPMVLDLLAGKTVFAHSAERTTRIGFGSLYAIAASNGKTLRIYQFDDIDDGIFKGFLMWMEGGHEVREFPQLAEFTQEAV